MLLNASKIVDKLSIASGKVCNIANDNGGGQIIISGDSQAFNDINDVIKEFGIKKANAMHSLLKYILNF